MGATGHNLTIPSDNHQCLYKARPSRPLCNQTPNLLLAGTQRHTRPQESSPRILGLDQERSVGMSLDGFEYSFHLTIVCKGDVPVCHGENL